MIPKLWVPKLLLHIRWIAEPIGLVLFYNKSQDLKIYSRAVSNQPLATRLT